MTITLNGDTGITTPMYNGSVASNTVTPSVNMKNRIINGGMVIDQRNAGASVTYNTTANTYSLDRWRIRSTDTAAFTVQQVSDAPAGFVNSAKITVTTADASPAATSIYSFQQIIEGYNVADLNFGSVNAKTVTVSFWVKSSLTGTFGGALRNGGGDYSYPFSYTISSANTWEYKTVTIAGSTAGTWPTDNFAGMSLFLAIGTGSNYQGTANTWANISAFAPTGSTNLISTNGSTLQFTGVQLEVGSSATSFDYRPYGTELALCQRYYQTWGGVNNFECVGAVGACTGNIYTEMILATNINMRTTPTATYSALSDWFVSTPSSTAITSFTTDLQTTKVVRLNFTLTSATLTNGNACYLRANNTTNARYNLSAEL